MALSNHDAMHLIDEIDASIVSAGLAQLRSIQFLLSVDACFAVISCC